VAEFGAPTDFGGSLSVSRKNARGVFEKRDRRRSVRPPVSSRQIREGWIGREALAGLSDERRDRVRGVAEFGI